MRRSLEQIQHEAGVIAWTVRLKRKELGYTQTVFAERAGVGVRFLRELERGKRSLRLDLVEQVLAFVGLEISLAPLQRKTE